MVVADVQQIVVARKRFYITSLPPNAEKLLAAIRAHWTIENTLRWSLDVTFREDMSRTRKDHAVLNLATIRRAAFNLLKKTPETASLPKQAAQRRTER